MRPIDHPEFFHRPPPAGRSRESGIVLDQAGRFWHQGRQVEHPKLRYAFSTWIRRHPHDGRYILCNGYDWTYLTVVDVPHRVLRVWELAGSLWGELSDGSEEALDLPSLRSGTQDALYVSVKGGQAEARFTQHAQTSLLPFVSSTPSGELAITVGGTPYPVATS